MSFFTSILLMVITQIFFEFKVSDPTVRVIFKTGDIRKESRILVSFGFDTSDIHGKLIDVWLEIPGELPPQLQTLKAIEFAPLTTPWDPEDVSWDHPWENPGGDFDTSSVRILPTPALTGRIDMMWYIIDLYTGLPRYGILLKPSVADGNNFTSEPDILINLLKQSTLHIEYLPTKRDHSVIKTKGLGRQKVD